MYAQKYQWHIFIILCSVCCITLLAYVLPIRRLYMSAETRDIAVMLIEQSATHYSLPRSDFFFTYIGTNEFRLCRREYGRGADPMTCDWLTVYSPTKN